MAFAKDEKPKSKNQVLDDRVLRLRDERRQILREVWKRTWAGIIEEYRSLHQKNKEMTEKSRLLQGILEGQVIRKDDRIVPPVPETTNQMYGWIANVEEFKLECYGRDVDKPLPLPDQFRVTY